MIAGVSTAVDLLNAGSARLGTYTAMASPGVIFNIAVLLLALLTSISPTQIRDDTPTVPVSPQTGIMRDLGNSSHTDEDIHRCAQPDVKSSRFRHLAAILNSLKQLDVLDINDPRCFTLEEIRKSVSDSEGLIQVNLALLVRVEQRNVAGDTGYGDFPVEPPEEMHCIDIIMNAPKGGSVASATAIPIKTSSARDDQLTGDTISNEGDDSEEVVEWIVSGGKPASCAATDDIVAAASRKSDKNAAHTGSSCNLMLISDAWRGLGESVLTSIKCICKEGFELPSGTDFTAPVFEYDPTPKDARAVPG